MKKRTSKKSKRRLRNILIAFVALVVFAITPPGQYVINYINTPYTDEELSGALFSFDSNHNSAFNVTWDDEEDSDTNSESVSNNGDTSAADSSTLSIVDAFDSDDDIMLVAAVDVGQGACSLVVLPDGTSILIDTGYYEYVDNVTYALDEQGIETLDIFIMTHPHADHIGSAATIIRDYSPEIVYAPTVTNQEIDTTSYDMAMESIEETNVSVVSPSAGDVIYSEDNCTVTIISPASAEEQYEDLNDFSIGAIIRYGETSFLIDGDATSVSETEMLESGIDLDVDILFVPHHGSSSSSSTDWLAAVTPAIACISVGADNEYGHPTDQTISNLSVYTSDIYLTSEYGSVYFRTNGTSYTITTQITAETLAPAA